MSPLELEFVAGSHTALRNLLAVEIGIEHYDWQGTTYGNRVLRHQLVYTAGSENVRCRSAPRSGCGCIVTDKRALQ